jgi:Ca2+-binding EF-hand superfamily protein
MFKNIDTDNSGTITLDELKQGLAKQGTKLSEQEVLQLMEAVRKNPNKLLNSLTLYCKSLNYLIPSSLLLFWHLIEGK